VYLVSDGISEISIIEYMQLYSKNDEWGEDRFSETEEMGIYSKHPHENGRGRKTTKASQASFCRNSVRHCSSFPKSVFSSLHAYLSLLVRLLH
jgi:hypothetical protein